MNTIGKNNSKSNQQSKGKWKDSNPRKEGNPKPSDGSIGSKEKDTKGKSKCTYCNSGYHPESSCMKKTIDLIAHTLQQNNLGHLIPENSKKKEEKTPKTKGNAHALIAIHSS